MTLVLNKTQDAGKYHTGSGSICIRSKLIQRAAVSCSVTAASIGVHNFYEAAACRRSSLLRLSACTVASMPVAPQEC